MVSTTAVPKYVRSKIQDAPKKGLDRDDEVVIHRLAPLVSIGQMVWSSGVRKTVEATQPDLVIAIGLGKVFPKSILRKGPYRLAILLGDNSQTYLQMGMVQKLLQSWIKKPVYEKALRTADRIFTYTPETESVIKQWISPTGARELAQKNKAISLGFDPTTFYMDEELRIKARQELGIEAHETLIISTARMGGNKRYDELITAVEVLVKKQVPVKCLFVGLGDDVTSSDVVDRLKKSPAPGAFITRPFLPRSELNRLYNAADIGFWPITAISIYEGMGTGLFLFLPKSPSLTHLELDGTQGLYVGSSFSDDLERAVHSDPNSPREQRHTKAVEKFSYHSIARRMLDSI